MKTAGKNGFVSIDAVVGIMILGAVTSALAVAVSSQSRVAGRLSQSRQANAVAEDVLTRLQAKLPARDSITEEQIEIIKLPDPAPTGQVWTQVRVTAGKHVTSLIGLTPAAPAKAQP